MVGMDIGSKVFGNVPVDAKNCAIMGCDNPKLLDHMMEVYMRNAELEKSYEAPSHTDTLHKDTLHTGMITASRTQTPSNGRSGQSR